MGILCQINLFKPPDGVYTAGSSIQGIIKYGVDEVTVFDKITVSLKGQGNLIVEEQHEKNNSTYSEKEVYIDDDVIVTNEKGIAHEIGMYQTRFDFQLPENIPSSFHYRGRNTSFVVRCDIIYYVRIKFERPGFLQFTKRFKKELTVVSMLKPTLPTEPTIYGEQKKLFQLFSSKRNIVDLKANIRKSVIPTGGKIELDCEVTNDTDVIIKGIEVKLVETHKFKTSAKDVTFNKDVVDTDTKTGSIKSDETKIHDIVINLPTDASTLVFSKIAFRNYAVRITVQLPFPHINAVLDIPVEIGDLIRDSDVVDDVNEDTPSDYENPPPYWVAMGEMTNKEEFYSEK
ncbi:arrestin domain-containing protein 5 [Amyelois transitella]|uniref:arrestin domain-containing protein 5 n=1 Tax=Amyelois transitella TaxID=680683 RepID=UPI00298FFBB3|nr:arrestin domain-containing protein 5 [Amyelois transitella]XP_013199287.2 arrestin domain-containing protein 5 [Amyelois transitella]XP_060808009.1 arrestin domain-containing protein 5 [Amyelois transitella]